jgi:hypothetical protein
MESLHIGSLKFSTPRDTSRRARNALYPPHSILSVNGPALRETTITAVMAFPNGRKRKWTAEEDESLRIAVETFGTNSWSRIATLLPTRCGKQCRERWTAQIAPTVLKDDWAVGEDLILVRMHELHGNNWTAIARELPGRPPLSIKNRWNWLKRHRPSLVAPTVDLVDQEKRPQMVFASLSLNDGLFGTAFQEFREKMLMGPP